jgi:hypothetical protein
MGWAKKIWWYWLMKFQGFLQLGSTSFFFKFYSPVLAIMDNEFYGLF